MQKQNLMSVKNKTKQQQQQQQKNHPKTNSMIQSHHHVHNLSRWHITIDSFMISTRLTRLYHTKVQFKGMKYYMIMTTKSGLQKGTKWAIFGGKRIHSMLHWKGSIVSAEIRTPDPRVVNRMIYHWATWLADE